MDRVIKRINVDFLGSWPIFPQFVMCFYVQKDKISLQTPNISQKFHYHITLIFPAMSGTSMVEGKAIATAPTPKISLIKQVTHNPWPVFVIFFIGT